MVVPQYAYTEREIVLARWFFPISFVRIAANIAFASAVKCFNHAAQKENRLRSIQNKRTYERNAYSPIICDRYEYTVTTYVNLNDESIFFSR